MPEILRCAQNGSSWGGTCLVEELKRFLLIPSELFLHARMSFSPVHLSDAWFVGDCRIHRKSSNLC